MKRFALILLISMALATSASALRPIDDIAEGAPAVEARQGMIQITVNGGETAFKFYIFSITGQLVKTVTVKDSVVTVELPQGCYIVKCEKWSKKIIVS